MNKEKTTIIFKEKESTNPSSKIENLDNADQMLAPAIPAGQLEKDIEAKTGVMDKVLSETSYVKEFSIPKIVYDLAFITVLLPAFLYFHTYLYKLGKFNFYGIPSDYIDVGYNDILALISILLAFLFIFFMPLYYFFVPQEVLEDLVEEDKGKSKWLSISEQKQKIVFVLLILIVLFIIVCDINEYRTSILYGLKEYWDFAGSVYELIFLFILMMAMYLVQSVWNTKDIPRQKLLKLGSVTFTTLLFLISTTGISQQLGEFHAARKTTYEKVCSPEKNWIRIGKSGDRIIAKEINELTNKLDERTVLIGANCNDFVLLENTSLTPVR